jgi:succinoglycan biosynthesis transport protein ExoP
MRSDAQQPMPADLDELDAAPQWARASRSRAANTAVKPVVDPSIAALLREDDADENVNWPARLAPERLLRGLLLRWRLVATAVLVAALIGVAIALLAIQRQWESSVTLIMQDQSEELSVGGGQPYRTRNYTLETLIDTIKLPTSLDETLRRAGVEADRRQLAGAIDLSLAQKSDILNLKVSWSDPKESAALANALADVFVARTGGISQEQAAEAYRRYEAQLKDAQARVQQADAEILAFQLENKVTDFAEETKARLIDLSRLQAEYWTQAAEAEALSGAESDLENYIKSQPETVTSTLFRNPLQKRLEEYEWQLKGALTRYTVENPKVIKLQQQVESLRSLAATSGPTGPEPIQSPNDLKRDLNVKLQDVKERARVAGARARGLESSIAEQGDKLASLSALEKQFRQLESKQETTRGLERSLASKMEEARVAMASGDSSLQIVERSLVPTESLPSGRKLVVLALLVLGGVIGVAVALLAELRDPLVRCRADAQGWSPEAPTFELERGQQEVSPRVLSAQDPVFRAYRRIAGDLAATMADCEAVAVASAGPGEGRSSVARGLAVAMSVRGERCLLVDGDLRVDAGPRCVDAANGPHGVMEVLGMAARASEVRRQDAIERLHSVAVGNLSDAPGDALLLVGQPVFSAALGSLRTGSESLVVDLPPSGTDEGAFEAVVRTGAAVVVARFGVTRRSDAEALVRRLESRGVSIVAVLVIDVPPERQARYAGPGAREILMSSFQALVQRRRRSTSDA